MIYKQKYVLHKYNYLFAMALFVVTVNLYRHVYSAIYVCISKKVGRRYGSGIGIGK